MYIICADLEGVFTPEVWINVAERTGIPELRLTTRDISDYDVLMQKRLAILRENKVKLADIQSVIADMQPLDGAKAFLDWLRSRLPVIIVSDTFREFADPLMAKLGRPTLFCHHLSMSADGMIADYHLRQKRAKHKTALALTSLNYKVIGLGDSYNDVDMLMVSNHAIFFRPPLNIREEFPQISVSQSYAELKTIIEEIIVQDS